MTNYAGRSFLLKTGTWSGGTAIADCKTHSLKLNNEQVDITNKSSAGYRTLLSAAGTQSITITFGGVMTNDTGFETMQGYAFANSINAFAMQWADGDTLECSFAVSDFEVSGDHNSEQRFTVTLQSSGQWTFTPA
ncbi:MAG: phage tail protein [Planctomycetes bacterium]|nr:phage tail protein [Planctomycetota bacterium]